MSEVNLVWGKSNLVSAGHIFIFSNWIVYMSADNSRLDQLMPLKDVDDVSHEGCQIKIVTKLNPETGGFAWMRDRTHSHSQSAIADENQSSDYIFETRANGGMARLWDVFRDGLQSLAQRSGRRKKKIDRTPSPLLDRSGTSPFERMPKSTGNAIFKSFGWSGWASSTMSRGGNSTLCKDGMRGWEIVIKFPGEVSFLLIVPEGLGICLLYVHVCMSRVTCQV